MMVRVTSKFCLILIFAVCITKLYGACINHEPFWFKDPPELQPIYDENGEIIADKVWINFGRIHNRKCIDFFRVEFVKKDKTGTERVVSPRVPKFELGAEVKVIPCTKYTFRAAGYEEFRGTQKKFPVYSAAVNYTLDYTPKFIMQPMVYEKFGNPRNKTIATRDKRAIYEYTTTSTTPTPEPFIYVTVTFDLTYIDYPICLDRVMFAYWNIEWGEASFKKVYTEFRPGRSVAFVVTNKMLPCDPEFSFRTEVYGVNGDFTNTTWYPPSCVSTTPEPETTPTPMPEYRRCHAGASFVFLYLFCI